MAGSLLLQIVSAFVACTAFSVVFNAPRQELIWCGLCGSVSWVIYFIINSVFNESVAGTFFAALIVTALARFLSYARRAPSTMYHIAGILPLVPGMLVYNTMWGILNDDMIYSYSQGVMALKLAGVIGIGSIIVLSLPYSVFELIKITWEDDH